MEGKSFERELPRGYKLATVMDASKGAFAVVFTLISLVLFVISAFLVMLPVFSAPNSEELVNGGTSLYLMIGLVASIAYIVLHELVHGAAYKRLTREPLTYGFTFTCAYCGVPKIFTYRRTALISVLAPFVLFTLILVPAMVAAYFLSLGLYIVLGVVLIMHIQGCSGDLYVTALLLLKYRDRGILMNDTGPRMALFVPCDSMTEEDTAKTERFIAEMKEAEKKSK